jgi:hypothetical protein
MSETLNERLYIEEPVIAGRKVRPFSNSVKLKLARILRWIDMDETDKNEEILFAFIYLVAAPIERVSLNILNKSAYLADKDLFLDEISEADLKTAADWFVQVADLDRETQVEVVPKQGNSSSGETPPPNS